MYESKLQIGLGPGLTPIVKKLLIANGLIFLIQFMASWGRNESFIVDYFALWPQQVFQNFAFWQLVTYMFLHSTQSIFHILFNLFALWMFGGEVENSLGSARFLKLYLCSGIGAGLFHLLFFPHSSHPVLGASGAIYGVMVAFAVLFPTRVITLLLFFILPISIQAKYLVAIFLGISLFSGIQGALFGISDGVAHLAHLGGAVTALIFMRGRGLFDNVTFEYRKQRQWKKMADRNRREEIKKQTQQEIDRILDRINEVGFDGITEKEKKILKKSSEFLSHE
jgi:membrane associated rhomboid family serine protease